MKRAVQVCVLTAALGVVGGCEEKVQREKIPAATRMKLPDDPMSFTAPATTETGDEDWMYYALSTDEPKAFETPEGPDYKARKNGMAFKDTLEGRGPVVEVGQTVDLQYTLLHADKRPLESNIVEGKTRPFMFVFGQKSAAMEFWHEALIGMKKGGKRLVIVPPSLAYGQEGKEDRGIAPNETLILEVELKDIRGDSRAQIKAAAALALKGEKHEPVADVDHLVIQDTTVGTGEEVIAGKHVTVHYTGWLAKTGDKFDSSRGKEPFKFQLGAAKVIRGWERGVEGMKVGGKRVLTIPPSMGYGERGSPPTIPGGATLVFEVELLSIDD